MIVCSMAVAAANITTTAATNVTLYQQICASSRKLLCVTYPSAWNKTFIRTEDSKDQEKITAVYAYHQVNADTGFAEGLEASLSSDRSKFEVKTALAEDIQARKEIFSMVTYATFGPNWYVISGTDFRGNIFYSKIVKTEGHFKTLNILYPSSNKTYWSKVLRNITQNFR